MISRLNKEGFQVFVVTGDSVKRRVKPLEVFEEYHFKYDSHSISYILKSVDADVAIFSGVMDKSFDLINKADDVSSYVAGLTNIMVHCKNVNLKRFIYLSSCFLFDGNEEEVITESTSPNPISNSSKTIALGEKICIEFHKELNFEVDIIRVSEIYGKYKTEVLEDNICTKICRDALGDSIVIQNNLHHNLVYVDDAVDFIYRVAKKEKPEKTSKIFHVTSEHIGHTEEQLVQCLEPIIHIEKKVKLEENNHKKNRHIFLSSNAKEFGFSEKYDVNKGLKAVYEVLEKSSENRKVHRKQSSKFGLAAISGSTKAKIKPLIENIIFFLILQLFVIATKNINFFQYIDVYLFYVVAVALIYGYRQAAAAVLLCIFGKIHALSFSDTQYTIGYDYSVYLWILQIFTIGVLVGYLKDKYKRKFDDVNEESELLKLELSVIRDINNSNVAVKRLYEKRLLNYNDSFARIYDIVSQLDAIEPERVIFKSVYVMREIMNTEDVAVYTCDRNSQFCRLMAASSNRAKTMKKSLRLSEHADMYMKLHKQEIYVNSTMDPDYPMMAGGTYKDGVLETIIMIWSLPFEKSNLYEVNVFGVLCKLVEKTMDRAYEFIQSIDKANMGRYEGVMNLDAFEKMLQLYNYGEKEKLIDFTLLKAEVQGNMNEDEFYRRLKSQVRDSDYVGYNNDKEAYILLTNTNTHEASHVIQRLEKNQINTELGDRDDKFSKF